MTARETAGQVLRRWREAAGIGLREMAGLVACSPSFLTDIERGNRGLPRPRIMDFVVSYAPPERRGELLCELWAALDDRPWYRVDEVPPPVGEDVIVRHLLGGILLIEWGDPANRHDPAYWTHWRPLGRGPEEE